MRPQRALRVCQIENENELQYELWCRNYPTIVEVGTKSRSKWLTEDVVAKKMAINLDQPRSINLDLSWK